VKKARWLFAPIMLGIGVVSAMGACNGQGDCPAKGTIVPGASCSGDQLQCAYDVATSSPACDGATTAIASSCTCSNGAWACPPAFDCDSGSAGTGDGSSPGDDGSEPVGGEGGADATPLDT
jgi:hypothetical protein